jgi:acyl carrier protein
MTSSSEIGERITQHLRARLADVLEMEASAIDLDVPISAYGADSLISMMILTDLEAWARVELDPDLVTDGPSISEIAARITTFISQSL